MASPFTRSSVPGKRPHNPDPSTPVHNQTKRQLQTPDNTPNPKRPRTSIIAFDGDGNNENVPPFNTDAVASPPSPRATRLRRTTTSDGSPTRARQCMCLLLAWRVPLIFASSSHLATRLNICYRACHPHGRNRAAFARNSASYSSKLAHTHSCTCTRPSARNLQQLCHRDGWTRLGTRRDHRLLRVAHR